MKKKPVKYKFPVLSKVFDAIPGKKNFGIYRFLPFFFALGATLEFSMINWTVGETNFYSVFKKSRAKYLVEEEELNLTTRKE